MSAPNKTDFNLWIQQTAQLLRSHRWQEIDLEQLIEEVENLGKSERRAITSQLIRLLLHLLKWQYQPQRRSDSWLDSITDARTQIELAIQDSPSLKSYPSEQLNDSYQKARRQAAKQTGIEIVCFPEYCPYSLELVLDEDWLPEANK
jgi:integrase